MRYLDDELSAEEKLRVEMGIENSTELRRDLAIYRSMRRDLAALPEGGRAGRSVWGAVNRQLTRPVGWFLLVAGFLLWAGYGAWVFATSPTNPVEKLAVGALAVGFLILLFAAIFERLGEWKDDPYRDVER
ncbi:MAG TPA: hypothetical protein VK858_03315 [Longimicrobiales bacterium]|nr:hypothetical protein [Longimicrobiales bacterium]